MIISVITILITRKIFNKLTLHRFNKIFIPENTIDFYLTLCIKKIIFTL